ncbi:MAG: UDP-2,3-diacylglucosamine diphosphatase LpxI [bacterium]
MDQLGLIAGNGQFPFIVAREARKKGKEIVAVALKEEADPDLKNHVDKIHWVSLGQLGKIISLFKKEKVTEAVMAGQVKHNKLFANFSLDLKAIKLLASLRNKQTDSILSAIINEFEKSGIRFISSVTYLGGLIPGEGILTRAKPTSSEMEDIRFGFRLAKKVSALDIGQTIIVKDKAVVAIEAMEGTDASIMRAGSLAAPNGGKSGMVIVKISKLKQDLRFDVPVIGLKTVEVMHTAGAQVLAFEAHKTLLFDKEYFVRLADKYHLTIIGVSEKGMGTHLFEECPRY